jgi:hypothetical protein
MILLVDHQSDSVCSDKLVLLLATFLCNCCMDICTYMNEKDCYVLYDASKFGIDSCTIVCINICSLNATL